MATLYCERSIFDTMKRAGKTGLRWAVIGGVGVPIAVRAYEVNANEAAAAVAVFLGSLTLVVAALSRTPGAYMRKLGKKGGKASGASPQELG